MNQEVKETWVGALESGEFTQGRRKLATITPDGVEYCCLGVLCELARREGVVTTGTQWKNGTAQYITFGRASVLLPAEVVQWAGLDDISPSVEHEGHDRHLTELNDGQGPFPSLPFTEIASLIKRCL